MTTDKKIQEKDSKCPFRNKIEISMVQFQWMQSPIYKILEDYDKCIKQYLSDEESVSSEQEDRDIGFIRNIAMKRILDIFTYK